MERLRGYVFTTFSSLKIRNYRLYFIGQGTSQVGTWMQTIGQTWLVFTLTHSGTYVGLLTAVQFLPMLLLGPVGGLIVDRFEKRRLLFITQTTAMLLALTLATLVFTHTVQVWMVFALAAGLGLVQVTDSPTRQTFVLEMVGREQLTNAVTLNSVLVNLSRVIGPAIAGGLIAGVGIAYCFLLNGISYLAVLFCLWRMRVAELHSAPPIARAHGQLREGFRYAWGHPLVRSILVMMALIGTLAYEFPVVLPIFASKSFHGGAGSYALLMAAMGVGAVVGGFVTANRKRVDFRSIALAALGFGVAMLLTAAAPVLWVAAGLMVAVGIGSISFSSVANSTLQLETAPEMRGRVLSLWMMAFLGSTPIGGPIIGYVSEHTSPRVGLTLGGLAAIVAGLYALTLIRRAPGRRAQAQAPPPVSE